LRAPATTDVSTDGSTPLPKAGALAILELPSVQNSREIAVQLGLQRLAVGRENDLTNQAAQYISCLNPNRFIV